MTDIGTILSDGITLVNTYVWYIAFVFLVGLGLYFTYKLRGMQLLKIGRNAKMAFSGVGEGKKNAKVSSFEAFCIGLGARVGVGNVAGVASAIVAGGPGAIFWMWIFAIIGAASSYMESTLAQIFKEKKSDGQFHGGPAYYALKGLRSRKLSIVIALLIVITFGIGFVGVQASNSANALAEAFVFDHNEIIFGAIIALAAAAIIFGGVKRIATFSSKIVPPMAFAWLVFCIIVILLNWDGIVHAFAMIFQYAFGIEQVAGGLLGAVIMNGLKRGVFSNEAGLGSIANIASTAHVPHPAKQGLIQSFGTIFDTMAVCTCSALVILSFGDYAAGGALGDLIASGLDKTPLVQAVVSEHFGQIGSIIVSIFILLFAFTSLIGYYTMSESNIRFISDRKSTVFAVRVVVIVVAFVSCLIGVNMMETICDTFMAAMGAVNMCLVGLLCKFGFRAYDDWKKQRDAGIEEPVFHKECVEDLCKKYDSQITEWD